MQRRLGSWAGAVHLVFQTQRARVGECGWAARRGRVTPRPRAATAVLQRLFLRDADCGAFTSEALGRSVSRGAPGPGDLAATSKESCLHRRCGRGSAVHSGLGAGRVIPPPRDHSLCAETVNSRREGGTNDATGPGGK